MYPEDYNYLKGLVPELKSDIRERDLRIDLLESEMLDLRRQVKRKTEELTRLQRDVHKLRVSRACCAGGGRAACAACVRCLCKQSCMCVCV